ncbi:hypothetical protein KIL84_011177 [Mauremys mutica]|uniref:Uncharacterized protein n=1 Tax=Mauremys mutica TaxID=74926 RepID=A0A9D3XE24_9SAUR|nr:hypothetical protein KIL84_011177 [Mauremys mutica]
MWIWDTKKPISYFHSPLLTIYYAEIEQKIPPNFEHRFQRNGSQPSRVLKKIQNLPLWSGRGRGWLRERPCLAAYRSAPTSRELVSAARGQESGSLGRFVRGSRA